MARKKKTEENVTKLTEEVKTEITEANIPEENKTIEAAEAVETVEAIEEKTVETAQPLEIKAEQKVEAKPEEIIAEKTDKSKKILVKIDESKDKKQAKEPPAPVPAPAAQENNRIDQIEALLKEQVKQNKKMLALARVRTFMSVAITVIILAVVLFTVNFVNSIAGDIQGIINVANQLGEAGAFLGELSNVDLSILEDLGNLDMALLQDTMDRIAQLDFENLEQNMQILGDSLRVVQGLLEMFRLY